MDVLVGKSGTAALRARERDPACVHRGRRGGAVPVAAARCSAGILAGFLHLVILDDVKRDETDLAAIRASLSKEKRPELADYYGSMAGYDMLGVAPLNLVGWQVKGADVSSTDRGTKFDLWLGRDRFDPASFTIKDRE